MRGEVKALSFDQIEIRAFLDSRKFVWLLLENMINFSVFSAHFMLPLRANR